MELWSWILSIIGLTGFFLATRKVWWCWYVNIANQFLWTAYAIVTEQWGFLLASAAYMFVFVSGAIKWTKEHFNPLPAMTLKEYAAADVRATEKLYEPKAEEVFPRELSKTFEIDMLEVSLDEGLIQRDIEAQVNSWMDDLKAQGYILELHTDLIMSDLFADNKPYTKLVTAVVKATGREKT